MNNKHKRNDRALGRYPRSTVNESASGAAGPITSQLQPCHTNKLDVNDGATVHENSASRLPVPISVAMKLVKPFSKAAIVMQLLSRRAEDVELPTLAVASGSLAAHSVIAHIRTRFAWKIKNRLEWDNGWRSWYRLLAPVPKAGNGQNRKQL